MGVTYKDRVKDTTTTTGTVAITLSGTAPAGYQAFASAFSTNDDIPYTIEAVNGSGVPTGEWESGLGRLTAATTFARTTVYASSNSGALVNFSAGTKNVFCSLIAQNANIDETTAIPLKLGYYNLWNQ